MRKIKKFFIFLMICMIPVLTVSCKNPFIHMPDEYEETVWTSTEPDIWFEISEIKYLYSYQCNAYGQANVNDDTYEFIVDFDVNQTTTYFCDTNATEGEIFDETVLLSGEGTLKGNRFELKIDKSSDKLFNGAYDTIIFEGKESE